MKVSTGCIVWGVICAVQHSYASLSVDYALEATDESWDDVMANNSLILAGFFAPWCAHCKKLKPEWDQVAEYFAVESEEKVAVVSVDVVANPGLYWKYDITSFPTVRFVRNGVALSQCDDREAEDIIKWVEERQAIAKSVPLVSQANPQSIQVQLSHLVSSHEISNPMFKTAVIGLFGSEHESLTDAFRSLAVSLHTSDELKSPPLALITDDKVILEELPSLINSLDTTALSSGPAIVLLRSFANDMNPNSESESELSSITTNIMDNAVVLYYDDLLKFSDQASSSSLVFHDALMTKVKDWIENHRWPKVMTWSQENKPFIFTRRPGFETHVLLFLPSSSSSSSSSNDEEEGGVDSSSMQDSFGLLAEKYVPNALFLYCEHDEETNALMTSLNIDVKQLPSAIVIKSSAAESSVSYYRRSDESQPFASGLQLENYVHDYFGGKLEPTSPNRKSPPKQLVDQVVDESDVIVLKEESEFDDLLEATNTGDTKLAVVEFYAPWCGHCKKLKPEFARAATELKQHQVQFAKADATDLNLVELSKKLDVNGYPSLFVFFNGNVLPYGGGRTYASLVETCKSILESYDQVDSAIVQYLTRYERNSDQGEDQGGRSDLYITDKQSFNKLLSSTISSSESSTVLAMLLAPPPPFGDEKEVKQEMKDVFEAFLASAGRIGADSSILSDTKVIFTIVETSEEIVETLTEMRFPTGVASAIYTNQIPVFAVQKVPSSSSDEMTWEVPYVANTELLYEHAPAGVFSAEWSSRRAINFLKYTVRPSVVAFGDNAPFHSLMENPEVMQLLLFDDFHSNQQQGDEEVLEAAVDRLSPLLSPLVAQHMKKFVVVLVDAKAAEALQYFKLTKEDLPASRLVDITEQRSYLIPLPETARLGSFASGELVYVQALALAMEEAFDTEQIQLTPVRRIQPASEAELGRPNQLIVGEMWKSYVLERTLLDVLILYFDPNCPHCKAMRPVLDQLAHVINNAKGLYPSGNLAIMEMDVSANDPLEGETWTTPKSVPAVHLYRAQSGDDSGVVRRKSDEFVAYEGGPELKQIQSFLQREAKYGGISSTTDKTEL